MANDASSRMRTEGSSMRWSNCCAGWVTSLPSIMDGRAERSSDRMESPACPPNTGGCRGRPMPKKRCSGFHASVGECARSRTGGHGKAVAAGSLPSRPCRAFRSAASRWIRPATCSCVARAGFQPIIPNPGTTGSASPSTRRRGRCWRSSQPWNWPSATRANGSTR